MLKSLKRESRVLVGASNKSRGLRVFLGFVERSVDSIDATISLTSLEEEFISKLTRKIVNSNYYGELRLAVIAGFTGPEGLEFYVETKIPTMILDYRSYLPIAGYGIRNVKHTYNFYVKNRGFRNLTSSIRGVEEFLKIALEAVDEREI